MFHVEHGEHMANISILNELSNIEDFVRWGVKQDEIGGFNICISKHPGKSYILAKCADTLKPLHVLPVQLDYADPIIRPLITEAVKKGMGVKMTPEEMEAEMVCKSD